MNRPRLALLALCAAFPAWPQQLPPACAPYGARCLYSPGPALRFTSSGIDFSYNDATGQSRRVNVQVRIPANLAQGSALLPVMIWSQGGRLSDDAENTMRAWSETTAAAGYLTVTVAHAPRDEANLAAACQFFKVPDEQYCLPEALGYLDRPNDLLRVIAALETYNAAGPAEIRGRIDLARVATGGFAEGAGAALSVAGAKRMLLPTATRSEPDVFSSPKPVAFVALSPSGPLKEGFYDYDYRQPTDSWSEIRRPVLTVSGLGDNDCRGNGLSECVWGNTPVMRTIPFSLMPAGGKYEMMVRSVNLYHEFLGELDTDGCEAKGVEPGECASHSALLRSAVMAFLDANVRKSPAAETWIANGLIGPASGGTVNWRRK